MKLHELPHRNIVGWRQKLLDNRKKLHRIQFESAKKDSRASALGKQARMKNATVKPSTRQQATQRRNISETSRPNKSGERGAAAE